MMISLLFSLSSSSPFFSLASGIWASHNVAYSEIPLKASFLVPAFHAVVSQAPHSNYLFMSSHLILNFHVFPDIFLKKNVQAPIICQIPMPSFDPFLSPVTAGSFLPSSCSFPLNRAPPFKLFFYFIAFAIQKLQVLLCAWLKQA